MMPSEARSLRINFNLELAMQIPANMSSRQALALVFKSFVDHNRGCLSSDYTIDLILQPVLQLQRYIESIDVPELGTPIQNDVACLGLYRDALEISQTSTASYLHIKSGKLPFRDSAEGRIIGFINDYMSLEDFVEKWTFGNSFSCWVRRLVNTGRISFAQGISQSCKSSCTRRRCFLSYGDFSKGTMESLYFILDALLIERGADWDPFMAREVDSTLTRAMKLFRTNVNKSELVFDWFLQSVDLNADVLKESRDSPLFTFVRNFTPAVPESMYSGHTNILPCLAFMCIQGDHLVFEKFLRRVPALVAIPGLFLTRDLDVSPDWPLYAGSLIQTSEQLESVVDALSRVQSTDLTPLNAWDNHNLVIGSHFGQFGIGLPNPVDALIEADVQFNAEDVDRVKFYSLLSLIFRYSETGNHVGEILHMFEKYFKPDPILADAIVCVLIEEIYHPYICRLFSDNDQSIDDSILSSALSVIESTVSTEYKSFMDQYRTVLVLISINRSGVSSVIDPTFFVQGKAIDRKSIFVSPNSAIVVWMSRIVIEDPIGKARLVSDAAARLGLITPVQETIVKDFLNNAWDGDIDMFLSAVPRASFTSIVKNVVSDRLGVLAQHLCEDTSRYHGILPVMLMSRENSLDNLLTRTISKSSGQNILEWLLSDACETTTCLEILRSCQHLLSHSLILTGKDIDQLEFVTRTMINLISGS